MSRVAARGPKVLPTKPCRPSSGRSTIIVVAAPASTGRITSSVPRMAASTEDSPSSSRRRMMFSRTTTVASTTIPTARITAERVTMFSSMSSAFITPKVMP